jgi:fructose-bisphosphate aldolase class II
MFQSAYAGAYAIGAFNVNNMELIQGIADAAAETRAPLILQVSAGARKYARHEYLMKLIEAAEADTGLPIAVHLDHGEDFEICKACIDGGFTSVMIDGSKHTFAENVRITREVTEYAHAHGVVVEGELGRIAGIEDDVNVSDEDAGYTMPDEVEEFVTKTGVDSLAISIGTNHGAFKFKPGQTPRLRFDILDEVSARLPGFPIVLHGASSVVPKYVEIINKNGGAIADAVGIPEDMLREAARRAVCKINIDTDLRLAMTAGVRETLNNSPAEFDPRKYLAPARDYVRALVRDKIVNVLGCDGKA